MRQSLKTRVNSRNKLIVWESAILNQVKNRYLDSFCDVGAISSVICWLTERPGVETQLLCHF